MSTKNLLFGLLVGAAAGAVIGMLYAPDKGENLRRKIKDQTGKLTSDIKDGVDEILDNLKNQMDDVKSGSASAAKEAREKGEELKSKVSSAAN